MSIHKKVMRVYFLWLATTSTVVVFHSLYFEPVGLYFFQVWFLASLVALSIIYLGANATRLGKGFASVLGTCLLIGNYIYFGKMTDSIDLRLQILLLLGISIALNIALQILIERKAGIKQRRAL